MAELDEQTKEQSRALYEGRVREEIFRGTRGDLLGNPPSATLMVALPGVDATTAFKWVLAEKRDNAIEQQRNGELTDPTQRALILRMADLRRLHPDYDPNAPGKNDGEVLPWCQFILEDARARKLSIVLELEPSLLSPQAMKDWTQAARRDDLYPDVKVVMVTETPLERSVRDFESDIARQRAAIVQGESEHEGHEQVLPPPELNVPAGVTTSPEELLQQSWHITSLVQAMLQGGATELVVQSSLGHDLFNLTTRELPAPEWRSSLTEEELEDASLDVTDTLFEVVLGLEKAKNPHTLPALNLLAEAPAILEGLISSLPGRYLKTTELEKLQGILADCYHQGSSPALSTPPERLETMDQLRVGIVAEIDARLSKPTTTHEFIQRGTTDRMFHPEIVAEVEQRMEATLADPTQAFPEQAFLQADRQGILVVTDRVGEGLAVDLAFVNLYQSASHQRAPQEVSTIRIEEPARNDWVGDAAVQYGIASVKDWRTQILEAQQAGEFVVMSLQVDSRNSAPGLVGQIIDLFPSGRVGLCLEVSSPLQRQQATFAQYPLDCKKFEPHRLNCAAALRDVAEGLPPGEDKTGLFNVVKDLIQAGGKSEAVGNHLVVAAKILDAITPESVGPEVAPLQKKAQAVLAATQAAIPRFDQSAGAETLSVFQASIIEAQQRGVAQIAITTAGEKWPVSISSPQDSDMARLQDSLGKASNRDATPWELVGAYRSCDTLARDFGGLGFPAELREGVFQQQAAVAREIGQNPTARQCLEEKMGKDNAVKASLRMAEAMVKKRDDGLRLRELPADVDLQELHKARVVKVSTHHAVLQRGGGGSFQAVLLETLEERGIKISDDQKLVVPGVEKDAQRGRDFGLN